MKRYTDLHFFLDESGKLTSPRDVNLVGGVLMFGPYAPHDDAGLRSLLKQRLEEVGGRFPQDLHFFKSTLSDQSKQEFLRRLEQDIRDWNADHRATYGVAITHTSDIHAEASRLLAEPHYDNRYLGMLWALVEHLCFVDGKVIDRLAPEAKIHVHIASRVYPIADAPGLRDELESLGWSSKPDRWRKGTLIVRSTNVAEVRGMVRIALRQRWGNTPRPISSIEMHRLDYDRGDAPAALYLADLQLGLIRLMEMKARSPHFKSPARASLLPVFRRLKYGPWLDCLAEAQAALQAEDLARYLRAGTNYAAVSAAFSAHEGVVHRQEKAAAQLAAETPTILTQYVEEVSAIVDEPGRALEGARQADLAQRLLRTTGQRFPRAEALVVQAHLSHANHTGQREQADAAWAEFIALEPMLPKLGIDGLRLAAEIRNRRAVSLTDQFLFEEAATVLHALVNSQERLITSVADAFGLSRSDLPSRTLAACLGSLGQVHALRGNDSENAQACFRRAISLFSDTADIERQWIYLGHLACDQGQVARPLWDEVLSEIPSLRDALVPIGEPGLQYHLALQAKGILVFGDLDMARSFLSVWDKQRPAVALSQDSQSHHPFGLIYQTIGMMHARVFQDSHQEESRESARMWFDVATAHFSGGGPLLKALACVARIRKYVLVPSNPTKARQALARALAVIKGILIEGIGDAAWLEHDDGRASGAVGELDPGPGHDIVARTKSIVTAFRFNYW